LESNEPISAYDITGLKNLGKSNPIVFFNACQAGKGGMGLTGLNGWPKQFIDNNASAFIGAYWSIHDESAMKFAISFYRLLSTGMTIGQAFRQARLAIKEEGNPTWLAYTLYADPFARCKSS
jgi:CHAT domain-containing protein